MGRFLHDAQVRHDESQPAAEHAALERRSTHTH